MPFLRHAFVAAAAAAIDYAFFFTPLLRYADYAFVIPISSFRFRRRRRHFRFFAVIFASPCVVIRNVMACRSRRCLRSHAMLP